MLRPPGLPPSQQGKVLIIVQADKGARHVIVKIQDTGCGIAPDELRHLLVPFKQANMTMSRSDSCGERRFDQRSQWRPTD
jgi:signal transduction histidine kinase